MTTLEAKQELSDACLEFVKSPTPYVLAHRADRLVAAYKGLLRACHNKPRYRKFKEAVAYIERWARDQVKHNKTSDKRRLIAVGYAFTIRESIYRDQIDT